MVYQYFKKMIYQLFIIGFITLLGQISIIRELNVSYFGIELIYIIAIGTWMLGTAFGAYYKRSMTVIPESRLNFIFGLYAVILILELVFIRSSRILFLGIPGTYLPLFTQIVVLLISLIPVSFLAGLLFQWAAKIHVSKASSLAKAYSIESFGSVVAGLFSALFLYIGFQNLAILLLCGFLTLLIPVVRSQGKTRLFYITGAVLIIISFFFSQKIDSELTRISHPTLLASKDTPYGRITITQREDQKVLYENDALSYEDESLAAEELVHIPLSIHNNPKKVLVLGGGFTGILKELVKYDQLRIDYLEINKQLLKLIQVYMPETWNAFASSECVQIIHDDPEQYLTKSSDKYDVIFIMMPEPSSIQNNRFYTTDFFSHCKERMNPDAILAFPLRSAENLWSKQLRMRNGSIYSSLKKKFKEIKVLPGTDNIYLSSDKKFVSNPDSINRRFLIRQISAKLVTPEYINYVLINDRNNYIYNQLTGIEFPENTDLKPVCFSLTVLIWLSKFIPSLMNINIKLNTYIILFFILALIIYTFLSICLKKKRKHLLTNLAFMAGFIGIGIESIIIVIYQSQYGSLFQDIGYLFTAFMSGLGLGAYFMNKYFYHNTGLVKKKLKTTGYMIICLLCLFLILFLLLIHINIGINLFFSVLFIFINGLLISSIFAYASLSGEEKQYKIISPLYAVDVAGGAFGSILFSLFLIPISGILFSILILLIFSLILLLHV